MADDNVHPLWTNDELDEALGSMRVTDLPDRQPLVAARNTLLDAVRSLEGSEAPMPDTDTKTLSGPAGQPVARPDRRWWISVAAAAAVVAIGTAVALNDSGNGVPSAATPSVVQAPPMEFVSVQQALGTAADKIHVAGDTSVPAGKFRYVEEHAWYLNQYGRDGQQTFGFLSETRTQTWQPSDIDQEWLLRTAPTGNKRWFAGDEQGWKASGFGESPRPNGEWRAAGGKFPGEAGRDGDEWSAPSKKELAAFPRDPQKFYDFMRADPYVAQKAGDQGVLQLGVWLLTSGALPADLKETLYRALAKLPGLKVTEQVANLDGRKGVALGIANGYYNHELIVDPTTGEYIGTRQTQLKTEGDVKAGTVTGYTSVRTAIADQMGTAPAGS